MKQYSTDTELISFYGSATLAATTAGTTILIPSTATGRIHITDLVFSNGATAGGWAYFGYGTGATAPTGSSILVNNIYSIASFSQVMSFNIPIVVPAQKNFLVTTVTSTTCGITVVYYIAP